MNCDGWAEIIPYTQNPAYMENSDNRLELYTALFSRWPTILLSGSVVVKHFAFPEDLECGIACNSKTRGNLILNGGVHLGQRNGGRALAQLLGCLLILWSQTLTVSAPEGQLYNRQLMKNVLIVLTITPMDIGVSFPSVFPNWPWGVELHQDDVCIVNSLIKVFLGQHQCRLRRGLPIWLRHLFHPGHNSCNKQAVAILLQSLLKKKSGSVWKAMMVVKWMKCPLPVSVLSPS